MSKLSLLFLEKMRKIYVVGIIQVFLILPQTLQAINTELYVVKATTPLRSGFR
jgi:hypothetical protein